MPTITPANGALVLAGIAGTVTATKIRKNPPPNAADNVPVFWDPLLRTYYSSRPPRRS